MYAACGGEREGGNWGLPAPQAGFPRPRQEDCVPLHPLLNSYTYTNKKPFIRKGRKAIPWYHPDVPSIIQLSRTGLIGGPEGARTPDLDSAIVALSQLSYIP